MCLKPQESANLKETAYSKKRYTVTFQKCIRCFSQNISNSFLFVSLLVAICIFFCVDRGLETSKNIRYGVVIDAGSSGTRVHVCSFTLQEDSLSLKSDHYYEVQYSLTRCFQNTSRVTNLGYVFSNLLNFVRSIVPAAERSKTPIFLKATAGLRLVDKDIVESVLDATRGILISSEFLFEPSRAMVISGTDEALYGWITVNSLLNTISQESNHTYGILDLGGGSFQVAYHTNISCDERNLRHVSISDKAFDVCSQSFLGMGLLEFRRRLYKVIERRDELRQNPCFYKDSTEIIDVDGREQNFVETSGMGDFDACVARIRHTFMEEFNTSVRDSRIMWSPNVDKFVAFAYFFDRIVTFGLAADSCVSDVAEMGRNVCSKEWSVVKEQYGIVRNGGSEHLCFDMAYIFFLLSEFLGFNETEKKLWFLQSYQEKEFGWSLGALFYEMNHLLFEKQVL